MTPAGLPDWGDSSVSLAWACATLASVPLALTLFNLAFWPRGRRTGAPLRDVSVLIPARNEEASIERAVRSAVATGALEVVVYDDGSTDDTPVILARLAGELPTLRIVRGVPLPEGWVGKPHACHQLASLARGRWYFFLDADVCLEADALRRIGDLVARHDADAVTAVPRQETGTWAERLIVPLLHLSYTAWLPLPLIWRTHDPRFLAANGQVLCVRAKAYAAVGGFAAVRADVVDDMAFCRNLKLARRRIVFADGFRIARCRMYRGARGVWEGFSKNFYEGIGGHPAALALVEALHVAAFLLPFAWLALATNDPRLLAPGLAGSLAIVATRVALALRMRHPWQAVVGHPIAILGLLAIGLNSMRWVMRGRVQWAGRTYAAKNERGGAATLTSTPPPLSAEARRVG